MEYDYTKTDRLLLLLLTICKAHRLTLLEDKLNEILANPSKAKFHKLVNELKGEVKSGRIFD